jgi:hypothetical protein
MKHFRFTERTIPFALFLICVIAFGLLIPWLGFYWDDLPNLWFARQFGPQGILSAFQGDRPMLGYLFMVTTSLFVQNPLVWQIFGLLCRFLVVLAAWWTFFQVWPNKLFHVTIAAFFVAVFPGFGQQWISVIYSNVFLLMAASILSIGFTIKSIRDPRRYRLFTILSIALAMVNLFSLEYFVGQELLRPFFIYFVTTEEKRNKKSALLRTLHFWLPTLAVLFVFLIWRTFFFASNRYDMAGLEGLSKGIVSFSNQLFSDVLRDFVTSTINAWKNILYVNNVQDFHSITTILFWVIVVMSFTLVWIYTTTLDIKKDSGIDEAAKNEPSDRWAWQAMISGVVVSLISCLPYWVAGLQIHLVFPEDRFTISMMLSSSLFVVGLISFFISQRKKQVLVFAILIAFAIGNQFLTANSFKREWEQVRSFFWQLTWRIPDLKPGTMLISNELPLHYYTDNSLTAPLNSTYDPSLSKNEMNFLFVFDRLRSQTKWLSFKPNTPLSMVYRATTFTGNTSNSLALYEKNPGCLRIADKKIIDELLLPQKDDLIYLSAQLSDFSRIVAAPEMNVRPPDFFGKEPAHDWCYFYEKAELARQKNDWQTVISLGDQAIQNHIGSYDPGEWFPFIEGYIHSNQLTRASERLEKVVEGIQGQYYQIKIDSICKVMTRIKTDLGGTITTEQSDWFLTEQKLLKCSD